ncbi:MAG: serine hydrolase [Candidatus Aminicenantes bacterium]|nr:MAG: serine hydrolase [Candidatus Aminicenantes bacterium]
MKKNLIISIALVFTFTGFLCAGERNSEIPGKLVTTGNIPYPETLGFDTKKLSEALKYAEKLPRLNSLLIAKNNYLVVEKYFNGFNRKKPGNIKSITKNILSALVGIAIQKGYLKSMNQKIHEFFPDEFKSNRDPQKKEITIKHLMTMTSGLESTSFKNINAWISSPHWVGYVLSRKLVRKPGKTFDYSTGNTHLISAILTKTTGMNTLEFARKHLFNHLDIQVHYWQKDRQGIYYGGNNMFLAPLDLMKFGILYLNDGKYEGKQVVPKEWIKTSTAFQVDPERLWSPFHLEGYGYLWWLLRMGPYDHYAAWGHGGQFIFIFPGLKLVVVITSRWQGPSSTVYYRNLSKLMEVYILPSATRG